MNPDNKGELEVAFRGYREGDLEAMYALDVICFEPPFRFSRGAMRRFASARWARVVIAEAAGEMVGFCIAHVEREGLGYVVTLDVAPAWRRKGLARSLMERSEQEARESGCLSMGLHVFVGNAAAIGFYERLGYGLVKEAKGFYGPGVDALVYAKRL